jgi:hypothetical protein
LAEGADDTFAALQTATDGKLAAAKRLLPPKLSFTARGAAAQPHRTDVVDDLMRAGIAVTAADF